ncbi:N-acetyltransferase [Clostridia bacterium]|nr:N-acetyltransferase [Clostridia bacterium]
MDRIICRAAVLTDLTLIHKCDRHISASALEEKIIRQEVFVAYQEDRLVGFLRYGLFWDNLPFMYQLFIDQPFRGQGFGRALTLYWEHRMRDLGYAFVMTSSQQNEYAQHFYERLGYLAVGGFCQPHDPYEILFTKMMCEDGDTNGVQRIV